MPFDGVPEYLNYNDSVDALGSYWYQIWISDPKKPKQLSLPNLPTPKSKFWSLSIDSDIFIIGGSDDLWTCYHLQLSYTISNSQRDKLKWTEMPDLNTGRYSASCWTFDNKYIYVFAGWTQYCKLLSSIEMIDTELLFLPQYKQTAAWLEVPISLPNSVDDCFSQQIDNGKIVILGGKYNQFGKNTTNWYLLGKCE